MTEQTIIVGGGISGLALAYQLAQDGRDFLLLEARDRFGGRVLSKPGSLAGESAMFDLGPAWFWPGQSQIASLIQALGLQDAVFEQWAQGQAIYEDHNGQRHVGIDGISMGGSYRLDGGIQRLIDALIAAINPVRLIHSSPVKRIRFNAEAAIVETTDQSIHANTVALAVPPRLAAETIGFEPTLPAARQIELSNRNTWMAGQAKFVATYQAPFWREAGFSGDAISMPGPLREIHDASARQGKPYALFGFFGLSPAERARSTRKELTALALEQLQRLFGPAAANPTAVLYKDWACDPCTATVTDQAGPSRHTMVPLNGIIEPGTHERIVWAGAESASHFIGYLEGALLAARQAGEIICERRGEPASADPNDDAEAVSDNRA